MTKKGDRELWSVRYNKELLEGWKDHLLYMGKAPRTAQEYWQSARYWLDHGPKAGNEKLVEWCFTGRKYQAAHRMLRHVVEFMRWAHKTKGVDQPFKNIRETPKPKPKERKKVIDPPTPEDIQKVINAEPDPQHRIIIMCAYTLGLRREELLRLNILDVRADHVRVWGKGNKERIVPIPLGMMRETLHKLVNYRLLATGGEDAHLFTRWSGERLTSPILGKIFFNAGKRVGIKIHAHLLRHAYASHLIQNGCPIEKVAVLMGHDNIKTTWRYAHLKVSADDVSYLENAVTI